MTFGRLRQLTQDGIPDEPASSISDEATKRHHHHRLSRTSAEHAVAMRPVTVTPDRIIAALFTTARPVFGWSMVTPTVPEKQVRTITTTPPLRAII
jgi:hypothetical protein